MSNVTDRLLKANLIQVQKVARTIARYVSLSALSFTMACSQGNDAIDKFLGSSPEDDAANYSLDLDPDAHDFGLVLTTVPTALTASITVKNKMTIPLFVSSVTGPSSPDFSVVSETCTALTLGMQPEETCLLTVSFKPTTAGNLSYAVPIKFGPSATVTESVATAQFLGEGATPANLLLSGGPTFDFGAVVASGSSERTLTMTNTGTWPATAIAGSGLSAPFDFKGGSFPGVGGTCSSTLAGSASCSIVAVFSPVATGPQTDTIEVSYFDGDVTQSSTRDVAGTGATPAQLTISDGPSYDYGTFAVGASIDKTFTISNSGGVPATSVLGSGVSAPFTFKGGTFPGAGGTCTGTITSGQSCSIVVSYRPTTVGVDTGTIRIDYFDALNSQNITRTVSGTAVPPAVLTISNSPSHNYGTLIIGAVGEQSFTISNTGGHDATLVSGTGLAAPFAFKGGNYPGAGGTCTANISVGSSCTVIVTYTPTSVGTFNDAVDINYNNGASVQTVSRAVQGSSVTAAILAISNGPTFNFGNRPTGSITEQTLTLTNTGGTPASIVTGSGLAAPFDFKGGSYPGIGGTCSTGLAAATSCTMVVTFAPTITGSQSDTLEISYDDGVTTRTSTRDLIGSAAAPASLSINNGPTYDYGNQPIGLTVDKSFIITNSGGFPATAIVGSGLTAPFNFRGASFPGTGGSCTSTLAAGATCTVVVRVQVASGGAFASTLEINYNNGVVGDMASRPITVTGVNPASISVSDGPAYDFGNVAVGASSEATLTLTNTGAFNASGVNGSGLAAPFSFKGGSFPGTGGTCANSLTPAATCTIVVRFAPTALGARADTINITYNNGVSSQTSPRNVQGLGAVPATLSISDGPSFNFGSLPTGGITDKSFTITNNGGVPASSMNGTSLASPFSFKGGTYPGTGGTCGAALAATASCVVVVEFAPLSGGSHSDTFDIVYFNGVSNSVAARALQGTAVNPAFLSISNGPTYNFGTVAVTGSADVALTVTNTGQYVATLINGTGLTAPFTFKGGLYPGTGGSCANSLNPSATCTIVVTYSPVATGLQTTTLNLQFNNGVSSVTSSRPIEGTGAAPAVLGMSDGPVFDFGAVAVTGSVDATISLSNSGGVTANAISGSGLAAPFSFKGGSFPGTGGTCTTILPAGGTCNIVVRYLPSVSGLSSDTIEITYTDGISAQTSTRNVQGTGVSPALISISDGPTYDFGSVPTTSSTDKILTLTNTGDLAAASMSGSGLAAPFTFKGGSYPGTGGSCGTSLSPAATCTVIVNFNPNTLATFNDAVVISYNNGVSTVTSTRDLQGIGAAPGSLTISDGPTYNFGSWPTGATREKIFTVTNSGGVTSSSITGDGLASPYTFKGGAYPGTGGTCAGSLAPSLSCTIVVEFSPSVVGTPSDSIELSYSNGVASVMSARGIQATAVAPGLLSISDGPTYDFGTVTAGATAEKSFNVTNIGGFATSGISGGGLAFPLIYKGGSYPGTGGTCGTNLNAGVTCTIIVVYAPSATGLNTDTIELDYNNGSSLQIATRNIQGTGADPAFLSLSDGPTYDFGTHPVGFIAYKTVVVTNSGGVTATSLSGSGLSAPFSFRGGTYPGTGGTCGTTLAASATCNVVIAYGPATTGVESGTVTIGYNNGLGLQSASRALTGTAVAPALIAISNGTTYNFGTLATGATSEFTFTVSNSGSFTATSIAGSGLSAPFAFKGGTFPGTGGTCGVSLNSGGTCSMVVTFAPTATGVRTGTISIGYNDGATAQTSLRPLQGTGALPASLTVTDGPTYNYGTRATGSSTDKSFTITNTGGVSATSFTASGLADPFLFKDGTFPGTGGTCTSTIGVGNSCVIVVTYAPSATGLQTDTIEFSYNDGAAAQTLNRGVQGTGAAPASLTINNGPTHDYGSLAVGGSADQTFTVSNGGGVPATSLSGTGLAAPFSFKGGTYPGNAGTCAATLNAGSTCTIVVNFTPSAAGLIADTINVVYNDGITTQTANRDVQGTGVTPATISISDGPTYSFGTLPATASLDKVITLTNTGSIAATTMTGAGLAAPYSFKGGSYPGTGGDCGGTLNSTASCTVVLTYAPTVNGSTSDTMDITFFDGAAARTSSLGVQGTAAPAANLTFSDGPTYSFPTLAAGGTADKTITVTNSGGVTATSMVGGGLSAPFTFKAGTYPGTGGTCGTTLNAAASCTVVITYNPTVIGTLTDAIEIAFNTGLGLSTGTRNLQGTAVAPASLTFSDGPTYDFGTVATGGVSEKILTVTNGGSFTATAMSGTGLSAPFTFKGGAYPGTGGSCATTLNAAATCTIVVRYAPVATGLQSSTVLLDYNDGAAAQQATRAIQGTGASPALLALSDGPTFDYGTIAVGGVSGRTFTISNSGGVSASAMSGSGLATPFAFAGGGYPGSGGTCGATLAAGANCSIVVNYSPTGVGTQSDSIDISYNNGVSTQSVSRALTGTSVTPATLTISDATTYNFGTLATGATADHSFTVTNTGSFNATSLVGSGLAAPYTFKGGSYPGTGGTCSASINAGAACTIVVTFAPTLTGLQSDSIDLTYNDGAASQTSSRAVQGTGATPASITISDGPTFDFGTKATGSSTDKSFTITNSGGVAATSLSGSGLAAPYTFKGGTFPGTGGTCTATLNPTISCFVIVTYAPTATGAQTDTLDLTYDNGVSAQTSSRNIAGTGAAPAQLAVSDGATFDYGQVAVGSSVDKTFTVTNSGGVTATSVSGAGLALPFSFKGGGFPGTGGTCGTTLAGGNTTCTFVVSYAPTGAGAGSDTIDISFNNGVTTQTASRDVQGTGVTPALLTISDATTYDYGAVPTTASVDHVFTVSNSGSMNATVMGGTGLAAPFTFKGGTYPGTGGTCGTSLNSGSTCSLVVTFNPTVTGSTTDSIEVGYFNGASTQSSTRDVQGLGALPASITISNGVTFNFGSVANGSIHEQSFTLTNSGGVLATSVSGSGLAAPFTFKGGSYPGTGATCTGTLAASASCTVIVVYNPTVLGTQSDSIDIGFNDGLTAQTSSRAITGTALAPASLALSDGPGYDYGIVATGATVERSFTVTNSGSFTATALSGGGLAAPFAFKGGAYPGTGGSCSTTLNAAASCTVIVTYSPAGTGSQSDTVEIYYNDGAANQTSTRNVQGTGATPALLSLTDGPLYNYGTVAVGSVNDKTLTISNGGGVTATGMSGTGLVAPFAFKGGGYPGTGGTCGTTLNTGSSCSVVVTYSPSGVAVHTDSIDIGYNDGAANQTTSRSVQGTAVAPATLTISDATTYNFGTLANGATADYSFTVTNTGSFSATGIGGSGLAAPFTFKGGSYPGTGGSCGGSLNAGSTCTVIVTFAPTISGLHSDSIDLGYNNGAALQTSSRGVQGTGAAPASLAVSDGPTNYDFGIKPTGSSTDKTFTVTNSGGVAATSFGGGGLVAPYTFKGGAYPGTGGNCGTSLAGGNATCTVVVTYAPVGTGTHTDSLDFSYNDGVTSQTASRGVTAVGATPAVIAISDSPTYSFGSLAAGGTTDKTFTISNTGGVSATGLSGAGLATPFSFKGGSFPGTGGNCTATLNAAANCSVVVTFNPSAPGSFSDTIDLTYNDGVAGQTSTRDVTGSAVTPASFLISDGPTYNFGSVVTTVSLDKVLTVTNSGATNATAMTGAGIAAPYTFKGGTYPGTGGTCGTSLNSGDTCTLVVTFTPSALGTFNDTIEIDYFDGAVNRQATRALQGTGATAASLAISNGPTYNFGSRASGSGTDFTFTVTNGGGVTATSMAGSGLAAPYTFKDGSYPGTGGTCGTNLSAAASCTIVVTYTPSTLAVHTDTAIVSYNDGQAAQNATRDLTGTGVAPALLGLSDGPTYDFGTLATGGALDKSFTVTNSGSFAATGLSGAGLAAPFAFKGGTYPGTGGNCSTSLNASATCTVVVTYSPSSTGVQSDSIELSYNDGANSQSASVGVTGTGANPALLTLSNGPLWDYGAVAVGSSNDKSITVTNSGGVSASSLSGTGLSAPFSFKGGGYPGTGGNCTATLAAGASCSVVVTYNPSVSGAHSDTIEVTYNNGVSAGQNASRNIQGSASAPALLTLTDGPTYDFGAKANGSSTDKTLTVTNTGSFTATSMGGSGLAAPYTFKGGTYPGGGTCGVSLNASDTCTIIVTFAPTVDGTHTDTAVITYHSGALAGQTVTRDFTGTSTAPATLVITGAPTYDYGTKATGSSTDYTLTVTNTGAFAATSLTGTGLSAPFSFKGGTYPGTGGTCSTSLNGGSTTCTIVVTYSPLATGLQTDTIDLGYNNGVSAQISSIDVQGTGASPAVIALTDGPTFDFGTKATGSSTDKTFTLSNTGGITATGLSGSGLAAPFTFKGGSFPGTGTCTGTLAPAATCTVIVTYSPSANGLLSDTMDIAYNDGAAAQTSSRSMQGTGIAPATLTITDGPTYDFGAVVTGGSRDRTFTVTNTGGLTATGIGGSGLAAPYTFKGGSFPGTGGNCGGTLNAAATCTMVVTFAPTVLGAATDTINIAYNDGANAQTSNRDLQGSGATPASLTLSEAEPFSYGTRAVGASVDHTFVVTNGGGVTATGMNGSGIAAPFTFKGGTYPGSGGSCAATLAATDTCTVIVTYAPTTAAAHSDTIDITYNDGQGAQTANRGVSGTGVPPASLSINLGPTYDYGTLATGATLDQTFTITNGGGVAASSMAGTGLSAPYTFKGGSYPGTAGTCAATLNPAATCTIVVTWAPVATGSQSATIQVTYNDSVNAQTATRAVTGTGAAAALLTISDGVTFNFGTVASGSVTDKIFTITNSGGVTATSVSGAGLAAPFRFKGGSFPGTGGTCSATLAGGGTTCTTVVQYAPTINGSNSDSIDLTYHNGVSAQATNRAVSGTAVAPASLAVSDGPTYDFGIVVTSGSSDKVFTIVGSSRVDLQACKLEYSIVSPK